MRVPAILARFPPGRLARLGLACIGAVTLGFILVCAGVLLQARHDATATAEQQARNIAASVAQDVGSNLGLYELSLEAVVQGLQNPGVMALQPDLRRMILFQRAARAAYFGFINVIDAGGAVTADSEFATPRPGSWERRDYFIAQRDGRGDSLFVGKPFELWPGPSPAISLSRRVSNPDGSFAGVVVGSMRLSYFHDLFSRLNLGPHGTIALLRHDGLVLMRLPFNAADIGGPLPPDAPFFRAPAGGPVDATDPTDHLRRRFLFQPIDKMPLVVEVGLADTDIYAAWRGRSVLVGLGMALLSVIDFALLLALRHASRRREQHEAALRVSHAELEALASERQRALEAMAQAAAAKSRFVAAMSHELRTPLNSILGYAELLALDGSLAPTEAGRLAALRSAGEHLRDVINRVLDFSRVEADDSPAAVARTDLPALVAQCREIAAPMAAAKGLRLTANIAPEVPACVMADAGAIRQVVLNLLSNAVKFTDHGEVALRVACDAGGIRFAVIDSGIGVPPAQRARLFSPYERLDADRRGIAGTGLGLAMAHHLVKRMGGHIAHADNPLGGSIFRFDLPLLEAADARAPDPAATPPRAARPLRVLVADDVALNRDVAAAFLRRAGHSVTEVEDGEAAVCQVAAEDFDVVLMDLRMPQLDGIEATRRIRALPGPRGRTPVIAVTAQISDDGGGALRKVGFQGCLLKPIDRQSLLAAIAGCVDAAPGRGPAASGAAPPPAVADDAAKPADPFAGDLEPGRLERHLAAFAAEVRDILALLDAPASGPALAEQAHRVAGDAGLLGYMGLSAAARRYESELASAGSTAADDTAELRRTASGVLDAIAQRSSLTRRAAMTSGKEM